MPSTARLPGTAQTTPAEQTHYKICPLCEACCGLEVRTQGTAVLSICCHERHVLSPPCDPARHRFFSARAHPVSAAPVSAAA